MSLEEKRGVFDEIADLGAKYNLTTDRCMKLISEKEKGEKITMESIMAELLGEEEYNNMDQGKRNMIFSALIQPDLDYATEEKGVANMLKKVEGGYERIEE